jgi:hypothetical protein
MNLELEIWNLELKDNCQLRAFFLNFLIPNSRFQILLSCFQKIIIFSISMSPFTTVSSLRGSQKKLYGAEIIVNAGVVIINHNKK